MTVAGNRFHSLSIYCGLTILLSSSLFILNSCKEDDAIPTPTITSFTPTSGIIGTIVNITGNNFSPTAENNIVKFNGTPAIVNSASASSLTVVVPPDASTGKITVTINTNTATSDLDYTVAIEAIKAGGSNSEHGSSVAVDKFGNTYVTGSFFGTTTFGINTFTSVGSNDIFLAKFNSSCDLIWAKHFGASGRDEAQYIETDAEGNIFMTGTFTGDVSFGSIPLSSNGSGDIFIAKFNSSGDAVWAKQMGSNDLQDEYGIGLEIDNAGNLYVTGQFRGTITIGATTLTPVGAADVFVAKYNTDSGNVIWANRYGGLGSEIGVSIAVHTTGDIYICGNFSGATSFGTIELPSTPGTNGFVTKLNSLGEVVWSKSVSGSNWNPALSVTVDADGNCSVAGSINGHATIGGATLNAVGADDMFLAKFNPAGTLIWAKTAGGIDLDAIQSIAVDATGNIYAAGYFEANATFGDHTLASVNGGRDAFVSKYNADGTLLWVRQAGGPGNDFAKSITVNTEGTVYVYGDFSQTVTFGATSQTSNGSSDIFLWKIWQ